MPICVPLFMVGLFGVTLPGKADVVTDWNDAAIAAIRATPSSSNPGDSTRVFAMVFTAIYDAVNCVKQTHTPYSQVTSPPPPNTSAEAASAQAAHDVLLSLFPSQAANFSGLLATQLNNIQNVEARNNGITVGSQIAQDMIALRSNDGAQISSNYTVTPGAGHWTPDPLHPAQTAWGPKWGEVKTWSGATISNYRPAPPPDLSSAEYAASVNMVKSLGAKDSLTRTADQTEIGIFWGYDRAGLGPPPILYNQVIAAVADLKGNTFEENARLFALANVAMADASIAAWDAKFAYDLWRPISAIREAYADGNPLTIADPNWEPLGAPGDPLIAGSDFTPPFPAYPSGHATMGAAAFRTLQLYYGSDSIGETLYFESDELPGIIRSYQTFGQLLQENSDSRIYLGVHFDFDQTVGTEVGTAIANSVGGLMFRPVPEPGTALFVGMAALLSLYRRRPVYRSGN